MKRLFLIFALALAVGLSTASASNWTYSFTSAYISGSGSLTATAPPGPTFHALTAPTGSITAGFGNGAALSLVPGGPGSTISPYGGFAYDNLFYYPPTAGSPDNYLDSGGLLFSFNSGVTNYELNVWGNGPGGAISGHNYTIYAQDKTGAYTALVDGSMAAFAVSPSAVPEPGFYGVLALGLSGLFVGVRRRRRT